MELELNDMQGLLVRGFGNLQGAQYMLFRFTTIEGATAYIRDLMPLITNAGEKPEDKALQLAFTYQGLRFLNLPEEALSSFSREFKEGMTDNHRRFILGDLGENDPVHWQWGDKKTREIHLLLLLYSKDKETLVDALAQELERTAHFKVELLHSLPTGMLHEHKEHFGFRDDLSRPIIEELVSGIEKIPGKTFPAGEFILGYKNLYDELAPSPSVPAEIDENAILPPTTNNELLKDLGKNGSYLVFRQMHQDVCKFWTFLLEKGGNKDEAIRLGSKMVGRWPDGTPMTLSPNQNKPDLAETNDFGYWDQDKWGLKCPIGAHIRRTNPRDHLVTEKTQVDSTQMVAKHRMLRKGRPYGEPVNKDLEPGKIMDMEADNKERGLHFICLVTDIRRQFEFVQNNWINFPKFGGLEHDADPLVGNHYKDGEFKTDEFSIPTYPVKEKLTGLPNFTLIRGGGYFFFPGIKAIQFLAHYEKSSDR